MKINNLYRNIYISNRINTYNKLINKSIEKLSSGQKINKASDSPSDMLRISRLEAETRGSRVAQNNIQSGIFLLQVAEGAMTEIKNMAERLRELSVQYNSDVLTDDDKKIIENESKELLKEMGNIINNTTFSNIKVFSNSDYMIQTGPYSGETYRITMPNFSNLQKIISNGQKEPSNNDNLDDIEEVDPGDNTRCHRKLCCHKKDHAKYPGDIEEPNDPGNIKDPEEPGNINDPDDPNNTATYIKEYHHNGKLKYEGYVVNGQYDGYGKLYYINGKLKYEGNWKEGKYDGYGKECFKNGKLKYDGTWNKGLKDGEGALYHESGKLIYQGEWKNDLRHGYGVEYNQGEIEYVGYWINDSKAPNYNPNSTNPYSNNNLYVNSLIQRVSTNIDNSSEESSKFDNIDISKILNSDFVDKNILNPITESIGQNGIMQNSLTTQLNLQIKNEEVKLEALSQIKDVDIAKETMNLIKNQMLLQTSTMLMSQTLNDRKQNIINLLI